MVEKSQVKNIKFLFLLTFFAIFHSIWSYFIDYLYKILDDKSKASLIRQVQNISRMQINTIIQYTNVMQSYYDVIISIHDIFK